MYLEAGGGSVRYSPDQLREVATSPETDEFLEQVLEILSSTEPPSRSRKTGKDRASPGETPRDERDVTDSPGIGSSSAVVG
jgi:hypothetical protein